MMSGDYLAGMFAGFWFALACMGAGIMAELWLQRRGKPKNPQAAKPMAKPSGKVISLAAEKASRAAAQINFDGAA